MDTQRICPNCQKPLAADVPMGLCPECLIKAAFATQGGTASQAGDEPAFVPPTVTELAAIFPQLEILEFIGKGGMGAVYKARQKQLDRIVALKILPPGVGAGAGFADRFTREARALAKLNHPAIVTLFEFGQAGGLYFFLMEFVDGMNLRQLLAARRISSREALAIVPQICDALQFAHDQGIVHRDIKPENILLDRRGRVKLADFGLAKLVGAANEPDAATAPIGATHTLTEAGKVMGTPNYMAPEQMENPGEVDNRADIYALGVVFYQMLTGELPGKPIEPPSHKVRMDVRLDEVVLRALEKKPELRYQQASEIKNKVETIAGSPTMAGFVPPQAGTAAGVPGAIRPATPLTPDGSGVAAPAVFLMIYGFAIVFAALICLVSIGFTVGLSNSAGIISSVTIGLVLLVPGLAIVFGAIQMIRLRGRAWGLAAAVLATLSVFGAPFGIWALVALSRPAVKLAFDPNAPRPSQPVPPGRAGWLVPVTVLVVVVLFLTAAAAAMFGVARAAMNNGGFSDAPDKFHEDFHMTMPLKPDGTLAVDNVNGRITVSGWDQNVVDVQGAKSASTQEDLDQIKVDVNSDTNRATIHTRIPSEHGFHWNLFRQHDEKVDYVIQVPRGAGLENVQSVNGKVQIAGVGGDIRAGTVNGGLEVKDAAGSLKLDTVNGRINAEMVRLGGNQSANFNTVNGEVSVALPPDADATVSANTVNGSIHSDFSELTPTREFPISSHLKGTLGSGSASVHAETVNGAIHFERGANHPAVQASTTDDYSPDLDGLQPVVVETDPPAGARNVSPGLTEIKVRFSKPMRDGSWSWCTAWDNSMPEIIGHPRYLADHRTCVIKVRMGPGTVYGTWLNSERYHGFVDRDGHPAAPYLLTFKTSGTPGAMIATNRDEAWRKDLDYLQKELPTRHLDFDELVSLESFNGTINQLKQDVPTLSDPQIIIRLMRLVAGIGVAHTGLDWSAKSAAFHRYPLMPHWCTDGLVIVAAGDGYQNTLGARVVKIGTQTPEALEKSLAVFISHENDAWLHQQSPNYMVMAELLKELKVAGADGSVDFTLSTNGGAPFTVHIPAIGAGEGGGTWTSANEVLHIPVSLSGKHPRSYYWRQYLPDSKTLFIQYNKCADAPGQPFSDFASATLAFAAANPVSRVVVDLRQNGGGSSEVINPLLDGLADAPALSASNHLYVLISGHTFSSGVMDAIYFKDRLHAVLVGRPTGGKPNCYGEINELKLPNTHLGVSYPLKHFEQIANSDPASLEPDIKVPFTVEDYLSGRDPDLEAVLQRQVL